MAQQNTGSAPRSAMAIAGLVLGILALLTSFVPIVNNLSAIVGFVGAVLSVVGVVGCVRGSRSGKGLAVAALAVNVVAVALVLATQSAYSAAIDKAVNGPDVSGVTQSDGDAGQGQQAATDLAPGASVELENGLTVSVDSVETGLVNYDDSTVIAVRVTYANNGDESVSYNQFDWKGEDANGAQEMATFYSEAEDDLGSGSLAAGGTKSGNLYFKDGTAKVLYFASIASKDPSASWTLE